MPSHKDVALANLLVRKGAVPQSVIDQCLRTIDQLGKAGARKSLSEMLVQDGYVTADQIRRSEAEASAGPAVSQGAGDPKTPGSDARRAARQAAALREGRLLEGVEFCDRCAVYVPDEDIRKGRAARTNDARLLCFRCFGVQVQEGDIAAGYRIGKRMRSSSLGNIYRATHLSTSQDVSVEVIPERNLTTRVPVNRLVEAAIFASKIEHPRVTRVYEAQLWQKAMYVAREFRPYKTLRELLDERREAGKGPVGVERSLQIGTDIAEALVCAWDKGVVHGTVRPEKVAIGEDNRAQLMDLGLPDLYFDVHLKPGEERPDEFAAPELKATDGQVDRRSDIYSLGQILCEMLSGKCWLQAVNPEHPFPESLPSFIVRVLKTMTAVEPKDRYVTPSHALKAMKECGERYRQLLKRVEGLKKEIADIEKETQKSHARTREFQGQKEKLLSERETRVKPLTAEAARIEESLNEKVGWAERWRRKGRLKEVRGEMKLSTKEYDIPLADVEAELKVEEEFRVKLASEKAKREKEMVDLYRG